MTLAGGLACRAILETTPNHHVRSFISLSSPQAGQYGGMCRQIVCLSLSRLYLLSTYWVRIYLWMHFQSCVLYSYNYYGQLIYQIFIYAVALLVTTSLPRSLKQNPNIFNDQNVLLISCNLVQGWQLHHCNNRFVLNLNGSVY